MTYCQPLDVDEVAAEFPRLKIIALHVGEPWPEVINHVAMHKTNVMRETSGMWPKYFPQCMLYEMNRRLQDKFIFGSEWGVFKLSEILKEWEELDLRPGIMEKVMYKNALNFLGERFEKCGLDLSPGKVNVTSRQKTLRAARSRNARGASWQNGEAFRRFFFFIKFIQIFAARSAEPLFPFASRL